MVYAVTSLCRNLHVICMWYEYDPPHTYTVSCCVHTQTCFVIYTANKSSTWIIVANICIEFVHNLDPFVMQSTQQSLQKKHTIAWSYLVSDVHIHKSSQWGQWDDSHVRSVNSQSLRMFCECVCEIRSWSSGTESCQCQLITLPKDASHTAGCKKIPHWKKLFKPGNKLHFEQFKTKKC